jgi:phage gp45-like
MKKLMFARIVLIVAMSLPPPAVGISGSNMEDKLTNISGNVMLDLKSGGKATFTMMGESMPCT